MSTFIKKILRKGYSKRNLDELWKYYRGGSWEHKFSVAQNPKRAYFLLTGKNGSRVSSKSSRKFLFKKMKKLINVSDPQERKEDLDFLNKNFKIVQKAFGVKRYKKIVDSPKKTQILPFRSSRSSDVEAYRNLKRSLAMDRQVARFNHEIKLQRTNSPQGSKASGYKRAIQRKSRFMKRIYEQMSGVPIEQVWPHEYRKWLKKT